MIKWGENKSNTSLPSKSKCPNSFQVISSAYHLVLLGAPGCSIFAGIENPRLSSSRSTQGCDTMGIRQLLRVGRQQCTKHFTWCVGVAPNVQGTVYPTKDMLY